jgi:phosphatidylinositol transfer protein SFH5
MSTPAPANSDPETKPTEPAQTERAPTDADEEPQNALTEKFTEKEWAALKELRVRAHQDSPHTSFLAHPQLILVQSLLPDILEKAYDSKEGARTTPIVIWGVTLDPNGKKDARASVILMKWLHARCVLLKPICVISCMFSYMWPRNLNVNDAKTMIIDTLRWREEFKIEEAMNETFPDVFNSFGHLYGRDKEGRPMMYFTLFRDRWLLDLTAPTGITYTVGITTLRLLSATCSGSFGALLEFCYITRSLIYLLSHVDGALR